MPRVNLGTCCGSDPSVGLWPWIHAGGVGIDTAESYKNQATIGAEIQSHQVSRDSLFITTKIETIDTAESCLAQVQSDLDQLNMKSVDLVLLHHPNRISKKKNQACWQGLEQAVAKGLARSIGVSNFNKKQIEGVLEVATIKPAVNQCSMNIQKHDDATIEYCQQQGITYEAFYVMKGCPSTDATVTAIAAAHGVSPYQICLRFILDRGCVAATGTGKNPDHVTPEAVEDLAVYDFKLSDTELAQLNGLSEAALTV